MLHWRNALALNQRCRKRAVRLACSVEDLVAGLALAAASLQMRLCAHQLRQVCINLILPVQGCVKVCQRQVGV